MKIEFDTKAKTIILKEKCTISELSEWMKSHKFDVTRWKVISSFEYWDRTPIVYPTGPPDFAPIVTCSSGL